MFFILKKIVALAVILHKFPVVPNLILNILYYASYVCFPPLAFVSLFTAPSLLCVNTTFLVSHWFTTKSTKILMFFFSSQLSTIIYYLLLSPKLSLIIYPPLFLTIPFRKGPDGQYTLKKAVEHDGKMVPTVSAHPARFSPDDQYSKQRIEMKKRHKLLPTQQPPLTY